MIHAALMYFIFYFFPDCQSENFHLSIYVRSVRVSLCVWMRANIAINRTF